MSDSLKNYTNDNIMYSYETLDNKLCQNSFVAEAWGKYKKNLARSKDENLVRIYSTVEAGEYFNIPAFTGSLYTHFYSGMAGVFTGIGILGTFVGLTIGLIGINTSSTAALQSGISVLLSGMTTAFWTSVVGISLGLIFNIVYSIILKRVTATVQTVAAHFERIFTRRTVEEILMEQSSEAQAQTAILSRLGTDMASALCDRLPDVLEGIADKLNDSLKGDLQQKFDLLLNELHQLNSGAITAVADSFNSGAGEQIAGFAKTLETLSDGMEEILRKSQETSQDVNAQIQETLQQMLQELQTSMSDNLSRQKEGMTEAVSQNQLMMEEMRETMKRMSESMEELANKSHSSIETAAREMAENAKMQSDEARKSAQAMSESTEQTLAALEQKISQMQQAMADHENALRQILLSMEKAMTSSTTLIQNAGKTADTFRQAAGPVQTAVNTMNGYITQMVQTTEKYGRQFNDNTKLIATTVDTNRKTLQNMQDVLVKTKAAWDAYETHFDKVKGELADTFQVLDDGLKQYNDATERGLNSKLQRFDETIGTAVGRLASITEESNESVEALTQAIANLKTSMNYGRR